MNEKNFDLRKIFFGAAAFLLAVIIASSPLLPMVNAFGYSLSEEKKPLEGKYISVLGDSISTYTGWSDSKPITDPSCTNRYGEAYYGPEGGDFHNTDLLVTDTWWHQAATELGAEILMSNAGNSTGLFCASYPQNAAWDLYLKEMLAYKSRPDYLGYNGIDPDIIALYIGSNELSRAKISEHGSVDAIDFDSLIKEQSDGTFVYNTPATVAEAYCILLHKISVRYPDAEVYVFAVVPNSGATASQMSTLLKRAYPLNEMFRDVADLFGAHVVELPEAFGLDPDGDSVVNQADLDEFKSCFNGDPHPNAKGFDVITECFVKTVLENTKYLVSVETRGGQFENVTVSSEKTVSDGVTEIIRSANNFSTESGMRVDFESSDTDLQKGLVAFEKYTSDDGLGFYEAEGGYEQYIEDKVLAGTVKIPLEEKGLSLFEGAEPGTEVFYGDERSASDDGIYNYYKTTVNKKGSISVNTVSVSSEQEPASTSGLSYVHSKLLPDKKYDYLEHEVEAFRQNPFVDYTIPEDSEFVFVGCDQYSLYWAALGYDSPAASFPGETPVYSDEEMDLYVGARHSIFKSRNLLVDKLYLPHKTVEQEKTPLRFDSVQHFNLVDADKNFVTTYCAEHGTDAFPGYGYDIENVADAHYYQKAQAEKILSIADNCYWGTEEGYGSLEEMKKKISAAGVLTEEELELLTEGAAMTASQYAIWTFTNYSQGKVFANVFLGNLDPNDIYFMPDGPVDDEEVSVIFKVYRYLTNLEPTPIDEDGKTTADTIINEKNFIKDVEMTVIEKPSDDPLNNDNDDTNDIYLADIAIKFDVKPVGAEGEMLEMTLTDENGNTLASGIISGGDNLVSNDGNGTFVFSGIKIKEGSNSINFNIHGTQNIEKKAYLFLSEVIDGTPSQTMVGIAEGVKAVNASLEVEFVAEIEDEEITREHFWRTEKTYSITPPEREPDKKDPDEENPNTGADPELA